MATFTLYLPDGLTAAMDAGRERLGLSRSLWVRRAVEAQLGAARGSGGGGACVFPAPYEVVNPVFLAERQAGTLGSMAESQVSRVGIVSDDRVPDGVAVQFEPAVREKPVQPRPIIQKAGEKT